MSRIHLAGIIPVANIESDFNIPTPEVLMPVAAEFTAIQKSVFECAMAGCNTIWIVVNDDMAPIIREVVGEWIYDPVYLHKPSKFSSELRKEIPIYYVPIHPKDRDRRDSYGWSALYGALCAWKVAHKLSKWLCPTKYFVSFPLSVYDVYEIRQYRKLINHKTNNFFLSYNNKTIKDNIAIAFTFTGDDFKKCRRSVNEQTTREYLPPSEGQPYPTQKRPLSERWSARYFPLKSIFEKVNETDATTAPIEWYYDISEWCNYCEFLGSQNNIIKPSAELTKPRRHVKLVNTEGIP